MSSQWADLEVEAIGGITRLAPDTKVEKLGPSKEDIELLTLALKVLLTDAETLHCSSAQPVGCSHQTARNLINVLSFPTLFVRRKEE